MNYLLKRYVEARYRSNKLCDCPNCKKQVVKKSRNHIFCKKGCKDSFWNKIRGYKFGRAIPEYPGGYSQWKKDLAQAEEQIAEEIIFGEKVMRYLVSRVNGEALGVFHYEEHAEAFLELMEKTTGDHYELQEIDVENVHEYI